MLLVVSVDINKCGYHIFDAFQDVLVDKALDFRVVVTLTHVIQAVVVGADTATTVVYPFVLL